MIYIEPTVYKQDNGSEIEIHNSILEYANDWIDISREFILYNGKIYKSDGTEGTVNDLGALYSFSKQFLYFQNNVKLQYNDGLITNGWRCPLHYNGNRFYNPETDSTNNPSRNMFLYPTDVDRGIILSNLYSQNGGASTDFFGVVACPGKSNEDPENRGFGARVYIEGSGNYPYAFSLYKCCFKVVNK